MAPHDRPSAHLRAAEDRARTPAWATPGAGAAAVRTICDASAVFTHDVSNPLQSLMVLLELSLDELEQQPELAARVEQCLDAGQRMRALIRDFASFTRSLRDVPAEPLGASMTRLQRLLERRLERQGIAIDVRWLDGEALEVDGAAFELVALNVLLAALDAVSGHTYGGCRLHVIGALEGPSAAVVRFQLTHEAREGASPSPVPFGRDAMERGLALGCTEALALVEDGPGTARLQIRGVTPQ
jgi:C4-dicarboxylate-specific signal transduction histidine kinase